MRTRCQAKGGEPTSFMLAPCAVRATEFAAAYVDSSSCPNTSASDSSRQMMNSQGWFCRAGVMPTARLLASAAACAVALCLALRYKRRRITAAPGGEHSDRRRPSKPVPYSPALLHRLALEHGTPYQLYDEEGIRNNTRRLLAAFQRYFPGFRQHFAVKALPNPAVLRVLVEEGCGLDCSSPAELHIAQVVGCRAEHICYTSNYTPTADLVSACCAGVVVNLDDGSLVDALAAALAGSGDTSVPKSAGSTSTRSFPDLISFRLNPGVGRTDSTTISNCLAGPDAKFGVSPANIVDAYRSAMRCGAKRFGMHMMTGSCVLSDAYWVESVGRILDVVASVRAELGIEFEFINIGGGLGIPYRPQCAAVDVEALAQRIHATLVRKCAEHGMPKPTLHMENGRYMTGPFGWLVTRVQVRCSEPHMNAGPCNLLCVGLPQAVKESFGQRYNGVDACMAHLMRPGMYGAYHHISVVPRVGATPRKSLVGGVQPTATKPTWAETHVVGSLCENNDWFAKGRLLPPLGVGDLLVVHDCGAHAHSMGFQYNGSLRAPELLVRDCAARDGAEEASDDVCATVSVIRTRETFASLFGNCPSYTEA